MGLGFAFWGIRGEGFGFMAWSFGCNWGFGFRVQDGGLFSYQELGLGFRA